VPELVGNEQQLADPGEDAPKRLSGSFLNTFTDLGDAHVTFSLEDGYLA
jgi:hypothetical protein